jgi:hypothetical protein
MDGDWWHLKQGVDYTVSTHNFRTNAYQLGRRHGLVVQSRVTDDGLLVRFAPPDGPAA